MILKKLRWKIISVKKDLLVKQNKNSGTGRNCCLQPFASYLPYFHLRGSGSVFRIWIQFISGSTTMVLIKSKNRRVVMFYVLGCC